MLRRPSASWLVATRMQPSGQACAQVLQPVQRSSNQSRFVRAYTGTGRETSGYSSVSTGLKSWRSVSPNAARDARAVGHPVPPVGKRPDRSPPDS